MAPTKTEPGWSWFDTARHDGSSPAAGRDEEDADVAVAFARCFATSDGQRVVRHLRRLTLERALGPGATDAHLRHLEGQRHLVTHMLALALLGSNER
jgi:hypothetical protein